MDASRVSVRDWALGCFHSLTDKFPKPFGGRCRKATLGVCTGGTPNGSTGGQPDSRVPAKVNFGVESHSQ